MRGGGGGGGVNKRKLQFTIYIVHNVCNSLSVEPCGNDRRGNLETWKPGNLKEREVPGTNGQLQGDAWETQTTDPNFSLLALPILGIT